ncbi:MAG: hypothetical protein GX915_10065 [Clostridiales bacterium]|nr:hypothetical protein [Clostridiales bacterium]
MKEAIYSAIERFDVIAECMGPLHIGSTSGSKDDVLIHPVSQRPFVQATGIAGALRAYYEKVFTETDAEELFGIMKENDSENASKIKITDGIFTSDVIMERRPHLSINPETGSCDSSEVLGTDKKSGHKYDMNYVGAGSRFIFSLYIFEKDEQYKERIVRCLSAMNSGEIQIGAKKSSGCGELCIKEASYIYFNLVNKEDRIKWYADTKPTEIIKLEANKSTYGYEIEVQAETENEMLIRSIAVAGYGDDTPDTVNIQNSKKEYIIPGSSIKGVIRNRVEMICNQLNLKEDTVAHIFGKRKDDEADGISGNAKFSDTIVGTREENDIMPIRKRIKVDKFTGGAMDGKLFSSKNIHGRLCIKISIIDDAYADRSCALILFALRDTANKMVSFGSSSSIGNGYLNVERVNVKANNNEEIIMDFVNSKLQDQNGMFARIMSTLNESEVI